jgi:hypothetical protein
MTFAQALTELDIVLGDSGNVTFTTDEKTRALTKAWNDPYVVNAVWDSTLSYTTGTYRYALPNTLTTIKDIYISPVGNTNPLPEPIDNGLWELVNGYIQFNQRADNIIPTTYKLYLKGNYKLITTDALTPVNMQEYVLALAGVETLKLLAHKKANLFVKNDITMAELIGLKRDLLNDVKELRTRLHKEYESA